MYITDSMADNAAVVEETSEQVSETAADDGAVAVEETPSQTKAFSERLNKMSAERSAAAVNGFVKSMNITNPYTGKVVETREEYEEYERMKAAEENGGDPNTAAELHRLRARLADYDAREEENKLLSDPKLGKYYEKYRDELVGVQAAERAVGNDISLEMLLRAKMAADIDTIIADRTADAQKDALEAIKANGTASPGSAGGAATGNSISYTNMSDAEFEKVYRAALNGDLKKS